MDQISCALAGRVSIHAFEGLAQEADEAPRIISDPSDNFAMIMWNHGLLTVGRNVGEAFSYMRRLIHACEVQERVMATGGEIREIPADVIEFTQNQMAERRGNKLSAVSTRTCISAWTCSSARRSRTEETGDAHGTLVCNDSDRTRPAAG